MSSGTQHDSMTSLTVIILGAGGLKGSNMRNQAVMIHRHFLEPVTPNPIDSGPHPCLSYN